MYLSPINLSETVVHCREQTVHSDYLKHAAAIDEACFPGLEVAPNAGPIANFLHGLAEPIKGLAVGPYGEFSKSLDELLQYVASRHEQRYADLAGVGHREG